MKTRVRILWVMLLAFLFVSAAKAQLYTGLRGGVGLAKWHYDLPAGVSEALNDDQEYMLTPYVAIPVEIRFSEFFALQPELVFFQKGTRMKSEFLDYDGESYSHEMDSRTMINYIELPVLGKGIYDLGVMEIFAIAGPQIGYALNGKYKTEETITNGTQETTKSDESIDFEEDNLARLAYGFVLGAGAGVPAGTGKVVIEARYEMGLNNLNTTTDSDFKIYDRAFGFSVGFTIPLGK